MIDGDSRVMVGIVKRRGAVWGGARVARGAAGGQGDQEDRVVHRVTKS